MISIDTKRFKDLERSLRTLSKRAVPIANRNFVNDAAFAILRSAKDEVRQNMTLRSSWTLRSMFVKRAKHAGHVARVGSREEYLNDQEFGAIKRKSGGVGVRIATGLSAGQEGQRPRTRLPRKANKIHNIKLNRSRIRKNRKNRNIALVHEALSSGKRFVFMDLGKRKGIFKVMGGRKRKRFNEDYRAKGAKVKMVHDLTRPFVRIPANPWLEPANAIVRPKMPRMYTRQLIKQIRRERAFHARR